MAQQQQQSIVQTPFAQPSDSSPESTAHPIHQAIKAMYVNWRRPNVALLACLRTPIQHQVRCAPFWPFSFVSNAWKISHLPPSVEHRSAAHSLISSSLAVLLALASRQDKAPFKYPVIQFAINDQV